MNSVRVRVIRATLWGTSSATRDAAGGMVREVYAHGDESRWMMDSVMEATK